MEPLRTHREHMKKTVRGMKNLKVFCEDNVSSKEFHDKLLASKIVISPWGLGSRIASDQKAILSGCILVKPDTDFVKTVPDLYQEQYYVKCKYDLSNVEEVCHMILQNYDQYFLKTQNAKKLFDSVKIEDYQKNFCKNITDCVSCYLGK